MFDSASLKTSTDYVQALAAPFIAGFAVQQGVEVLSSLVGLIAKIDSQVKWKKAIFSVCAVILSIIIVCGAKLDVLAPFVKGSTSNSIHLFTTVIFVSAGTEGFNSLLKWLGYKKETAKATAAKEKGTADGALQKLAT